MSKSVKKIWNGFTTILVILVVILALLLVGARLIGLQVFTVLSGSMEPTYHTGSLIYVTSPVSVSITEAVSPAQSTCMISPGLWFRCILALAFAR